MKIDYIIENGVPFFPQTFIKYEIPYGKNKYHRITYNKCLKAAKECIEYWKIKDLEWKERVFTKIDILHKRLINDTYRKK